MQARKLTHFKELSWKESGPYAKLAAECKHDGVKMREALKAAGFVVDIEEGKVGAWCRVYRPYTTEERLQCKPEATDVDCRHLVMQGYAADTNSAILHAVHGAVREEEARVVVGKVLDEKGYKVDESLRQTMESRYIREGGIARLTEDLKAFERAK